MTPAELRALLAKATPGPWRNSVNVPHGIWPVGSPRHLFTAGPTAAGTPEDAQLIVAMRNSYDALLDVVDELKNTRAMIVALMKEKAIEPHAMEVIGARMLGDIDAALAKVRTP